MSKNISPSLNNSPDLTRLFDLNRIESFAQLFMVILYAPLGLCLFIVRFFIFLYILLLSYVLVKTASLKSFVFRSLFLVLGVSVDVDELALEKLNPKVFIANHVSDLDSLVLTLLFPCLFVSDDHFPQYVQLLCRGSNFIHKRADFSPTRLDMPLVCFPESSKTNAKAGVFKFESWVFPQDLSTFHIIFIEPKRPFLNLNISPLEANWISDLFWILFLPVTIFHIRYISTITKQESESLEEFAKRVQMEMASKTNLNASSYTVGDKQELLKRLRTERNTQKTSKKSDRNANMKIDQMSAKVKEVLPQVPLSVIKTEIMETKNIDDTIERILSGTVSYEPETVPLASTSKQTPTSPSVEAPKLNLAAANFGKTAEERAQSFQERKEQMFRLARIRYIQKHGLIQQQS